ncbi:MAG: hypothetical protein Rubg2KO_24650 [Rubricoccaceae bacterium]
MALIGLATSVAAQTTFTVTTTSDDGAGSLRQAILDANANPGADGIAFNISGAGPHTIQPLSELPSLLGPTTLDGLTQPGASCDAWPATLQIVLDGSQIDLDAAPGIVDGLTVIAPGSLIRGLVIGGFTDGAAAGINTEPDADGTVIHCNYIGTTVGGDAAFSNTVGVELESNGNRIGGPEPGQRNLISGNGVYNVELFGYLGNRIDGNTIQGNFIGSDVTGQTALEIQDDTRDYSVLAIEVGIAPNTQIGGTDHAPWTCDRECNLIVGAGTRIGDLTSGTRVEGNFIGTTLDGTRAMVEEATPSLFNNGIWLNTRPDFSIGEGDPIWIGGPEAGAGNLISGNGDAGIELNSPSRDVFVQGNRIGTDRTGTFPIPNRSNGIEVSATGGPVEIGGEAVGEGNVIAFNGGGGVVVEPIFGGRIGSASSSAADQARISGNAIWGNAGLGIDLMGDGVTGNDPLDADPGPNLRMNQPRLDLATITTTAGLATVQGTFAGAPSQAVRIQAFASSTCDDARFGPGQRFLGGFDVTTDGQGEAAFSETFAVANLPAGWAVTTTATDAEGNTSEFSQCAPFPDDALVVSTTADNGPGSLRGALLAANGLPGTQTIAFDIPSGDAGCSGGVCTLQPESFLPAINGPVVIDGSTQSGAVCDGVTVEIRVELDGRDQLDSGLYFRGISRGSVVRGLAIGGFTDAHAARSGIGISFQDGYRFRDPDGLHALECVHIGTDASGLVARPNDIGVFAFSDSVTVGTPGRGVVISGNTKTGLHIVGGRGVVQASAIGVGADRSTPLGNGEHGIRLRAGETNSGDARSAFESRIGGTAPEQRNVIAHNGGDGIAIDVGLRHSILGNAIYGNGELAIDLGPDGPTDNDIPSPGCTFRCRPDADGGPNERMNWPEITSAGTDGSGGLTVTYSVPTDTLEAAFPLRVEFFLADPTGQALAYIGHDTYSEDDLASSTDKVTGITPAIPLGEAGLRVVATTTDAAGNTSEVSALSVPIPVEPTRGLPTTFELAAPWPNPVRQRATVRVALPKPSRLAVEVFDALGRRVRQLEDADRPTGWHELALDADGLASGVYLVRMTAGEGRARFVATHPFTIVR